MNEDLPKWINNLSILLSIIGFIITCFLFWEARKIRMSFMRKARIPEIVRDLDAISKELFEHLKSFENQKMNALQKIKDAKGVLEGTITKLDENHKTKINQFIQLCSEINPYEISQDKFWDVYTTLSGLVTYLKQIEKDSRWEQ